MENPRITSEENPKTRVITFPTPEGLPRAMTPMPIVEGDIKAGSEKIDITPRTPVAWIPDGDIETLSRQAIHRLRVRQ